MSHFKRILPSLVLAAALASCADTAEDTSPSEALESLSGPGTPTVVTETADESNTKQPLLHLSEELSETELADRISSMQPSIARDRSLRFSDPQLLRADAAPLLLTRLRNGDDKSEVKHALIAALPKTKGQYAQAVLDLLQSEESAELRADLADSLRLSTESTLALAGLKLAATDSSSTVRQRALYAIGHRKDGANLTGVLLQALRDSDASVHSASAKALGNLQITEAFAPLQAGLSNRSADVRLETLRAMARIDGNRAANLSELTTLAEDSDARVRTAAAKASAHGYSRN
ncbi:MAG: HEAT repeat domain-containing protein [Kofleriaceae bacterium]|nr:HEAT repeat domain-containing protein [Kofleriaceae bacterium]